MPEIIHHELRKARKPHTCDYCGEVINPCDTYHHFVLKYDGIYTWNEHDKCHYIADELWGYFDPDNEGLDSDHFDEGCGKICREFVCKDCEHQDPDDPCCNLDKFYCIDKLYTFLRTHRFVCVKNERGWYEWKMVPRKEPKDVLSHDL